MRFFQRESRECAAIELLHKTRTFFYKQKNVVNAAFGLSKSQLEKTLHETHLFQKSRCSHAAIFSQKISHHFADYVARMYSVVKPRVHRGGGNHAAAVVAGFGERKRFQKQVARKFSLRVKLNL